MLAAISRVSLDEYFERVYAVAFDDRKLLCGDAKEKTIALASVPAPQHAAFMRTFREGLDQEWVWIGCDVRIDVVRRLRELDGMAALTFVGLENGGIRDASSAHEVDRAG